MITRITQLSSVLWSLFWPLGKWNKCTLSCLRKRFAAVSAVGDFLPSLNILIQTFSIWPSHDNHPIVMLNFARSPSFYSIIIHLFGTCYVSDTGLDSGEHLFLCNKNLHSTFCVLEFKCLTNINTFNPLIKPIIWVLLLFPFIYEKRFLIQGIYLQSPLRYAVSPTLLPLLQSFLMNTEVGGR